MAIESLAQVEIPNPGKAVERYAFEFSGGMRQRAALLRTYLFANDIMLLDEPFGNLDAITRRKMQSCFVPSLIRLSSLRKDTYSQRLANWLKALSSRPIRSSLTRSCSLSDASIFLFWSETSSRPLFFRQAFSFCFRRLFSSFLWTRSINFCEKWWSIRPQTSCRTQRIKV